MKILGLIGGISYQSTLHYYEIINRLVNQKLGKQHCAKIIIVSLNFNEIVEALAVNNWALIENIMLEAAQQLINSGADFIAMCCNTLHKVAPFLEKNISIPLFHILNPVGKEIKKLKFNRVVLLGTKFTMQESFYQEYLLKHFDINTITPNAEEQEIVNQVIFDELCHGIVNTASRMAIEKIMQRLVVEEGAQAIILGCTELPMLLPFSANLKIPSLNTTLLHAQAIVHKTLQTYIKL